MGNLLDLIKNGGTVVPNPSYDKKTKAGKLQPQFVNSLDVNNVDTFSRDMAGLQVSNAYGLSQFGDPSAYSDYGVTVNPVSSQEELDTERANNQSNMEQTLRSASQTLNTMTLGTAIGFADLADAIIFGAQKLAGEDVNNDYQSDVTLALESAKKSIDDRLTIYRENPNEAWDVGDFAWWASNAPSIASSISLMLPSMAVTKGLSVLGKAVSFNKLANKLANAVNATQKTRQITTQLAGATTSGLTSRLLENYQEARQTFQDTGNYAREQLNKMSVEQRKEFYKNNPEFANKTDEEIVQAISKNSADLTFQEDWANAFFDIYQMYSLKNIWKGAMGATTSSSIKQINKQAAKMFGQDGKAITEAIATQSIAKQTGYTLKNIGTDLLKGVRTEWSEGVEEAVNYIASQDGMYNAQKYFDKNTPKPTIEAYLKDPMLWEQAFWGALGGVVFSGVGGKAGELYNKRMNKEWQSVEEQKKSEILSRSIAFGNYQDKINQIANGVNPFAYNEDGTISIIPGQEEQLRQVAEKEYQDTLILNAMNSGNIDLLEAFINDKNFTEGIVNKMNLDPSEAQKMASTFKSRIGETTKLYDNIMTLANKNGANFDVARVLATEYIQNKNVLSSYDNIVDWTREQLDNQINADGVDMSKTPEIMIRQAIINQLYNDVYSNIQSIENDMSLDQTTKDIRLEDLNKRIRLLQTPFNNIFSEDHVIGNLADKMEANTKKIDSLNEIANNLNNSHPEIFSSIYANVKAELDRDMIKDFINTDNKVIKRKVTELNNIFDKARVKIVENANKDLKEQFTKYGSIEVFNAINNQNNNILEEDRNIIKKAYKALDVYKSGNEMLKVKIRQLGKIADIERRRNQENNNIINQDELIKEDIIEETPPSTGSAESEIINPEFVNPIDNNLPEFNTELASPVEDVPSIDINPIQSSNQINIINNLPEDQTERDQILNNNLIDYIVNNNIEDHIESYRSNRQGYIDSMIEQGFGQEEASIEYDNFMAALFPDAMYSRVLESDIRKMMINSAKAIITNNDVNIESILLDFAKSIDSEGNARGKTINGITYLSIGGLIDYLTEQTGNKIIHNYLFDSIKNYLYESTRNKNKFRATDDATIRSMTNSQFINYIDSLTIARHNFANEEFSNNVNITDFEENNGIEQFNSLLTLNKNDNIEAKYDSKSNRIIIINLKDNIPLGYIGVPEINHNDGTYKAINNGWIYKINIDNQGIIHSDLKDGLIDILTNTEINNEEFIAALYDATFKYIIDKNSEETNKSINDLYNMFVKYHKNIIDKHTKTDADYKDLMVHIIEITKYAFKNEGFTSHESSISRWFNNLARSYSQAETIIKGDINGKVIVSNITYGVPNTENDSNYKGNNIKSTVIGYKETINQLGVVNSGNIQYSYNNNLISLNANDNLSKGNIVMKFVSPDGYSHNILCRQSSILDPENGKFINSLITSSKNLINNTIADYFSGKISFNEMGKLFTELINKDNGLFTGFDVIFKEDRSIAFKVKENDFDNTPFAITINAASGKYKSNIIVRREDIKTDQYKISKNSDSFGLVNNGNISKTNIDFMINPIIDKLFNDYIKIAVGITHINDSHKKDDTKTNRFIQRINNKTIIKVGDINKEYKSYQDFLVSENLVRTKLRKDNPSKNVNGNWKRTGTTRLEIQFAIPKQISKPTVIEEITSDIIIDRTLTAPQITEFAKSFIGNESIVAFDDFFKTFSNYTEDNGKSLDYIKELQNIGIMPSNIEVVSNFKDSNNKQVNALYSRRTNTIKINSKAFEGLTIDRAIRIIIHESIHQQLNINYDRKAALEKVSPIYNKFEEWLNNQNDDIKNNLSKYLFKELGNADQSNETRLEEFMVESITNIELMDTLNNIKIEDVDTNKTESLFTKIIKAIANIWNIIINENSLLAEARNIYGNILEGKQQAPRRRQKGKTLADIRNKPFTKSIAIDSSVDKIDTSEPNPNETVITKSKRRGNGLDFSSVVETSYRTRESLTKRIPYQIQADFEALLDDGTISFMC